MLKVVSSIPKCSVLRFSTKTAEKPIKQEAFMIENDINGMTVVSMNQPVKGISKVAAVFQAGSRFEKYETRGMNHLLRRSAGLASGDITAISLTRHMQQMGANLRCFGTRETLSYVVDFSFDMIENVGELLSNITTKQMFYNWELRDFAKPLMLADIQYVNRRDFDTLSSELLHKVAFGDSLGNSLFADEYQLGGWDLDHIEDFLDHSMVPKKSVLVGVNVKHDHLVALAEKFEIRPFKERTSECKFRGGEIRRELPLEYAKVTLAWETPGFNSIPCALASSILAYSIDQDCTNRIKWSNHTSDLIKKATSDIKVTEHCAANSINVSYSDKGLLGFTVTGSPDVMRDAVSGVHKYFVDVAKNGVKKEDFDVAKVLLTRDIMMKADTADGLLEHVISQATSVNGISDVNTLLAKVEAVTLDDVNKLAKHVLSSPKRAMVSIGDLGTVPYLADLS